MLVIPVPSTKEIEGRVLTRLERGRGMIEEEEVVAVEAAGEEVVGAATMILVAALEIVDGATEAA